jgi:hypothetical protein
MALPWVRLDANIGTHDKILALLAQRDGAKAFVLYVCGLGYAGGHSTDGRIPDHALPILHGNRRLAALLVDRGLWEYNGSGNSWVIHNWDHRQETSSITEARLLASKKANCIRWHGKDCGCWKDSA